MDRSIGLFDSGFGGLSVLREVANFLPQEDLIYLGDTAHLPYGNKSPKTILQFALDNSAFLLTKNIKLLIVACHTACAHALSTLQATLPIPVIGVIQPGIELAAPFQRVAILATSSTIESNTYQTLIQQQNPKAQVYAKACPLFVPLVEEGFLNHPSVHLIAETYLGPLRGRIDAALLACTHYPLLRSVLQCVLGPHVQLLEPAEKCALQAKSYLTTANLINPKKETRSIQFFTTDGPEKFQKWGEIFLGEEISKIERIEIPPSFYHRKS